MAVPLLPADFDDVTLAVVRQVGNNFHSYFSHIKKFIIRLLIADNGYFEQLLLQPLKLFPRSPQIQLCNLLQSIRFFPILIMTPNYF